MPEFKFTLDKNGTWEYHSDLPIDPRQAIMIIASLRRESAIPTVPVKSTPVEPTTVSLETFTRLLKKQPSLVSKIRLNDDRYIEVYCDKHNEWKPIHTITKSDCTSCNESKILADIRRLLV